jgi:hypothetical protein
MSASNGNNQDACMWNWKFAVIGGHRMSRTLNALDYLILRQIQGSFSEVDLKRRAVYCKQLGRFDGGCDMAGSVSLCASTLNL